VGAIFFHGGIESM